MAAKKPDVKPQGKAAPLPAVRKAAEPPAVDDMAAAMAADASKGFENVKATDMAIPFLCILQSGSPQIKRGEQQIKDAKEGDIFNTVTSEFFDGAEGIYFVPATFKKALVEWRPREEGGGFVAQHEEGDPEVLAGATKNEKGQLVNENGNVLVDTAYHYGLLVDPTTGEYATAVISMTSTQLKKSRKWNSLMAGLKMETADGRKFTPPMFGYMYKLATVPEENASGAWSGWDIELVGQVQSIDVYTAAKLFAENINKGIIKVTPPVTSPDDAVPY